MTEFAPCACGHWTDVHSGDKCIGIKTHRADPAFWDVDVVVCDCPGFSPCLHEEIEPYCPLCNGPTGDYGCRECGPRGSARCTNCDSETWDNGRTWE